MLEWQLWQHIIYVHTHTHTRVYLKTKWCISQQLLFLLTHFLLFIDLPTAPVIFVINLDVTTVQNLTREFCCCHWSRNLWRNLHFHSRIWLYSLQLVIFVICWDSGYPDTLCCWVILFLQVHSTEEVSSRFSSLIIQTETQERSHIRQWGWKKSTNDCPMGAYI